ncbi:MAG TPA: tetratricopeptide repeat protein [Candidatus Methylacidiphilales bacterium]|nr:tetratricopeptide repeat protein [Candidatus Methylacidiphilales bacterium]
MKWFLVGSLCLFCSVTWVRGDAAADLYNQGINALNNNQFDDAAKAFQTIVTSYPTFSQIDNAHLLAGRAYFFAKKYSDAITVLQKEAAANAKPEFRAQGLFLTALSQFSAAQEKSTPTSPDTAGYNEDAGTFTVLITYITQNPTADNKNFLEQALYFRSLANYEINKYDASAQDLVTLTTDSQYAQSLSRPDYLLQLGDIYSIQTSNLTGDKNASPAAVTDMANKAIATLDQVINDPNALVQANEASMSKAQVLVMLAQLNGNSSDGYQKALDAYRQVKRKADLIPAQQTRLQQLRDLAAKIAQQNALNHTAGGGDQLSLLINREQGKLDELQSADSPDPIIEALIGAAECYINITGPDGKKESDEARTILHRLIAHAKLTPDQQKKVDFSTLLTYVLGGQTDKAGKALDDYLAKHKGDPNADSLSLQIAQELFKRKDNEGALAQAQRSITDFPHGRYIGDAYTLEARILTAMGRIKESDAVVDNFLQANPSSPLAYQMLLTRGANKAANGDLPGALVDFGKVKDASGANPELQSGADASYIQTLQKMGKFDDVIAEAKKYEAKYPDGKALSAVMLFGAQALAAKNDPTAVAALQEVARKFPKDPIIAPIALYSVVEAYRKAGNLTLMLQAAKDLQTTCPEAYTQILLADDAVSDALMKQKPPRYDDAAALYEPLTKAGDDTIAAPAQNKIGDVRFAQAKAFHYQSLPPAGTPGVPITRADAEKALSAAESAYLATLKNWPTQLNAVGDAIEGLLNVAQRNRSWGVFKDDTDYEGYLSQVSKDLTSPDMQARFEMAKAGLVFIVKNGATQYPAALERYRKVVAANPGVTLTRQETDQFGTLLLDAKDYDTAQKVYQQLLSSASANDAASLATAYYGLGAVAMAQNKIPEAKDYFTKMLALPGGAAWSKHISDAQFGLAYAQEKAGVGNDLAAAKATYGQLMKSIQAGAVIQTKALLGYGRILEIQGNGLKPAPQGPNEFAVHYFQQPNLFFQTATPEQSAEGLYLAGQVYDKAGDKANAKVQYEAIKKTYKDSAPDWYAKAVQAEGQ